MENGEATVLGLRRSKPLFFFRWEGAFLIQNSPTKDFQWALPHPHLTWGHSSAFQAYQWHVPIRAPIKSAPFPWNISKHFDGSGFPPAGFLESLPPPLSSLTPTTSPPTATPPPTLLLCQYHPSLGEPQILNISCDGQWSRKHRARRERPRRGKRALSHFLGGAGVVDGKRMHCGLLEEPDMDSTGQFRLNQLNLSCGWKKRLVHKKIILWAAAAAAAS